MTPLPIDDALPRLTAALRDGRNAVLAAPPGAGKTTRVPLALIAEPWAAGRIVMLEPRRIAARAAAERMAMTLGQKTGATVGYRIRGESIPGSRIEVVTEGVLTRLMQTDPSLDGISAVLFDEIHERSIHADLGLALCLEAQGALRPDLRLLAMSATLDTAGLSRLMDGAVIESAGRMHPVETRWLDRPWRGRDGTIGGRTRLEDAAARLIERAAAETEGDLLVFLPGVPEINRTAARLATDAEVVPLHGSLPFAEQRRALVPGKHRRIVLSTAIAETSLTVPGVRVVVDCGRARRAETDPATGLSRLVTLPVSRAEAEQRRGRAGREAPGVCYRMWTKGEDGALPAAAPPEILTADLAPLALELAAWGAEPEALAFLDPPPAPAMAEARGLLAQLGALDADQRITPHGRAMAETPAHPRLAHMLLSTEMKAEAALLAALFSERDPLRAEGADIALRLRAIATPGGAADRGAIERIRAEARRLCPRRADPATAAAEAGALLSLAWPDRIAMRRPGDAPRYLMANGRGGSLAPGDGLAGAPFLVAVDVEDRRPEAIIRRAAALDEETLRALHGARIRRVQAIAWDRRTRQVTATLDERLGALTLASRPWKEAPHDALATALIEGLRDLGAAALPWTPSAESLRNRVRWLARQSGPLAATLPDWSDDGLLAAMEEWLAPWLTGQRTPDALGSLDLTQVLRTALGHETAAAVDRAAPRHFMTPLGREAPIDYAGETPMLSVRVQEMFGLSRHPTVGDPPVPLLVELLSPARRPVQKTADLPGFWRTSYADVRKDMRAQYPKHPWPEDPASAEPTARIKPRRSG